MAQTSLARFPLCAFAHEGPSDTLFIGIMLIESFPGSMVPSRRPIDKPLAPNDNPVVGWWLKAGFCRSDNPTGHAPHKAALQVHRQWIVCFRLMPRGPAARFVVHAAVLCNFERLGKRRAAIQAAMPDQDFNLDDRRTTPRLRALKRARVYRKDGAPGIDCTVRNLSATGARLVFPTPPSLPDEIDFYLVTENVRVPANVIWRDGNQVAVRFSKRLEWLLKRNPA